MFWMWFIRSNAVRFFALFNLWRHKKTNFFFFMHLHYHDLFPTPVAHMGKEVDPNKRLCEVFFTSVMNGPSVAHIQFHVAISHTKFQPKLCQTNCQISECLDDMWPPNLITEMRVENGFDCPVTGPHIFIYFCCLIKWSAVVDVCGPDSELVLQWNENPSVSVCDPQCVDGCWNYWINSALWVCVKIHLIHFTIIFNHSWHLI